jgi:hypothetical protein
MAVAETCVTQSAMQPADRDALAAAARALALKVQAGDDAGVRSSTIAEFAKDFGGIANAVQDAAPHLKGEAATVDQVYVLDASTNKRNADGSAPEASFYCNLNKTPAAAEFTIPGLPPGKYAFAMVRFAQAPAAEGNWLVSMLLRQDTAAGPWLLAGLYPKETTAASHDGIWYWTQARSFTAAKEPWDAYLYYLEAQRLLQPAGFVSSTHLDKLSSEMTAAVPPALANGIGPDNPLVIKAADGTEYRFTSIGPDNTLTKDKIDVAAHLKVDQLGDAATTRKRNLAAMSALVGAHPELRKGFHGVWVFSDAPGASPAGNEAAMEEIH